MYIFITVMISYADGHKVAAFVYHLLFNGMALASVIIPPMH